MFEVQKFCKNGHELTEENRAPGSTVGGKKKQSAGFARTQGIERFCGGNEMLFVNSNQL